METALIFLKTSQIIHQWSGLLKEIIFQSVLKLTARRNIWIVFDFLFIVLSTHAFILLLQPT